MATGRRGRVASAVGSRRAHLVVSGRRHPPWKTPAAKWPAVFREEATASGTCWARLARHLPSLVGPVLAPSEVAEVAGSAAAAVVVEEVAAAVAVGEAVGVASGNPLPSGASLVIAQSVDSGTDTATSLLHLGYLAAMVAALVGGLVAIIVLWYVRGRDPAIGLIAEYIPEPPDDLPPGAAGTLLDERADHQDVVATLLGLARHGAIQIHQVSRADEQSKGPPNYEIEVMDPSKTGSRLESDVLAALFDGNPIPGSRAMLRDIKGRFDSWEPKIKEDLYQELVDREYFKRSPEATRQRWRRISWFGLIISVVLGFLLVQATDAWALLPTVAAVVIFLGLMRMGRNMPQKTFHGAESAARWRAFRTYLQSISKYENLEESNALFDRYLSYAVAFGFEKQWIGTFAAAGASTPGWLDSRAPGGGFGWGAADVFLDGLQTAHWMGHLSGGGSGGMDVNLPDVDLPNMSLPNPGDFDIGGMAEGLGSGLEAASGGLGGLLDAAGGIFDSIDFDW